jgi:Putative Ig domain
MRSPLKLLLITASLVAASLGAATSAGAATPAPPTLITTNFACSNGVCEVGPGNVGMPFGAGLPGLPTVPQTCIPYTMSVISGSLPPGLQIADPGICGEWIITGTPTQAGTYAFTLQITPTQDGGGGPPGTQQLTITIGTGSSDRAVIRGASWNGHTSNLGVNGYDANVGALWSVSVTSTGRVLISNQLNVGTPDGHVGLRHAGGYPCPFGGCDLTVTNNLGFSGTVFLGPPKY